MENLWSPWRSQYIEDFKSPESSSDCFLCDSILHLAQTNSIEDYRKTLIVHQTQHSFVILNKFPYNAGHILICPKSHKADLSDLSDEEYLDLTNLLRLSTEIVKKIYNPHGYNLGLNNGSAGGAGVPGHLHFHIVPRWTGDTNFMTSIADVKVISQELSATFDKYFSEFSKLEQ